MNGIVDVDGTTIEDEGGMDPQRAAALLQETEREAKREFDFDPPMLSWYGGVIMLIGYGGVYLATLGQKHYVGPRGLWLLLVPVAIVAGVIVRTRLSERYMGGLSGVTRDRMRLVGIAYVFAIVGVYALDGAMKKAGASNAIVYGVFDASGPVLFWTGIAAGMCAWRQDIPGLVTTIALMVVAVGAAFAGPSGAWGVIAIGGFIVLVGHGSAKIWLERR